MCILCVFQKWARRVATMLPWLVIPLIGLWLLSQFLPPAFRFEITSPRLACVCVLLVTLLWYELLMPQLSAWRIRRNARLRERKRFEAIEMQKLRKTATRRCRNCLTPYRDQNPGGGRFMCSYCGHISKRPVLDLPVPPGLGISNSRILKDLVGKGGKMLNGKVWSDNSWMCNQDWLDNGNWVGGSFSGKSSYWRKNSGGIFGGDEHCFAEKSYSRLIIFIAKGLASFCLGIILLLKRIFRISSSEDDASMDAETRGLTKRGDNGVNCNESRGEKARRKAEEKRQARLEKEQLEEEERKQREEVARLVEERRKLRDEKAEAEKDRCIRSPRDKNGRKEAEKKRQESKKDKDRGSSKSNSDVDEIEKRAGMDVDRSKKGEADRREHRTGSESVKFNNNSEIGHGSKTATTNNHYRGNVGARYLDRMRGSFLSSSRAFSGGGFFGKGANTTATAPRDNRSTGSIDSIHNSGNRRESSLPERVPAKVNMHADDKTINRPVLIESQSYAAPKKSWQDLFTRSSAPPPSSANVMSRPNGKSQAEVQSPPLSGYPTSSQSYENPINFGLPSPFTLGTFPYGSAGSNTVFPLPSESKLPRVGEAPREESDIFQDPCYVPDPVSLIGPVSESLDNFQLDRCFTPDVGFENSHVMKSIPPFSEPIRPSPIESPMSRLRASEERHSSNSYLFPSTPRGKLSMDEPGNANEMGTWHMWNTSPLCPDGLGLVGSSPSWLLPPELNRSNKEGVLNPVPPKTMASLFKNVDQVLSDNHSPQKLVSSCQNVGTYSTSVRATTDDPWFSKSLYGSGGENHFTMNTQEGTTQKELVYGSPGGAASAHPFQMSQGNYWAKKESSGEGTGTGTGTGTGETTMGMRQQHPVGGLYSNPDVDSLWSYE